MAILMKLVNIKAFGCRRVVGAPRRLMRTNTVVILLLKKCFGLLFEEDFDIVVGLRCLFA